MSEFGFEEDHVVNVGVPLTQTQKQQDQFKHPICLAFHFGFKTTAFLFYLFPTASYIIRFIVCILCLAFDFYTVSIKCDWVYFNYFFFFQGEKHIWKAVSGIEMVE